MISRHVELLGKGQQLDEQEQVKPMRLSSVLDMYVSLSFFMEVNWIDYLITVDGLVDSIAGYVASLVLFWRPREASQNTEDHKKKLRPTTLPTLNCLLRDFSLNLI